MFCWEFVLHKKMKYDVRMVGILGISYADGFVFIGNDNGVVKIQYGAEIQYLCECVWKSDGMHKKTTSV